jgi:PAS domain S-box-containing protein
MPQTFNTIPNQYELFFKSASIGIIIADEAGVIISANDCMLRSTGYELNELVNEPVDLIIPLRSGRTYSSQHFKSIQQSGRESRVDGQVFHAKRKDGSIYPVEVSLNHYSLAGSDYFVAFVSDATRRVDDQLRIQKLYGELELTIENRTKELSRTLQVLEMLNEKMEHLLISQRAILDNARVMLFAMNNDGTIRFFNPEATRLTGYTEKEVVLKKNPTLFIDPISVQIFRDTFYNKHGVHFNEEMDVIREKALRNEINGHECRFVHKDGTYFPVSLTITPILHKNNQINGFMGLAVDLTDRKKAELNLLEALSKEKKLGDMKSRFVSLASHEFRTPLSTILSSAYLVEKYTAAEDQPKRSKHLSRIINTVNNLTLLLNDFLSVGKIEDGRLAVHPTLFDVRVFMESLLSEIRPLLKKGQTVQYHHQGSLDFVLDTSLLKNILLNLLSNAIKFSPEQIPIILSTNIVEDELNIQVSDKGIGIPLEDQEHLMDRFYRATNAAHIQGTGLGLYIVSKYVESMGGDMNFQSRPDQGTTFNLTFHCLKLTNNENHSVD